MATLDDVEMALVQTLATYLFPGQAYLPGAVGACSAPATGAPGAAPLNFSVKLFVGQPNTVQLDKNLNLGISNIAVYRNAGFSRDTTRFAPYHMTTSANVASLQAALGTGQVTFGGTMAAGLAVGVTVAKTCYAYLTSGSDTIASVVAALAAAIPGASAAGAVLTAPGVTSATVAVVQQVLYVTGTQEQLISVNIFAAALRDGNGNIVTSGHLVRAAIGALVNRLKSIQRSDGSITRFIGLPDGSQARVIWASEMDDDTVRRDDLWKRTIGFRVEYDESISLSAPTVIAPLVTGNINGTTLVWLGQGAPATNVLTDGAGNMLADGTGQPIGNTQ